MKLSPTIPNEECLMCDMGISPLPIMISLVGAGGKTSTLFWLANWLVRRGRRVLITTTTQMFVPPETLPRVFCRDPQKLPASVFHQPLMAVFSGWQADSGKVRGFDTETLAGLSTRDDVDIVLVEADGSRGLPLKAPALHEPCIPPSSQCVIAVSGGSAIGQTLGPETVHRWAEFSAITGAHTGEALTLSHLLSLICHPQGAFKNTPSAARRVWLVNRFYQSENLAADAFSALPETTPVEAIWLGAVQASPAIRYRLTASSAGHRMDT